MQQEAWARSWKLLSSSCPPNAEKVNGIAGSLLLCKLNHRLILQGNVAPMALTKLQAVCTVLRSESIFSNLKNKNQNLKKHWLHDIHYKGKQFVGARHTTSWPKHRLASLSLTISSGFTLHLSANVTVPNNRIISEARSCYSPRLKQQIYWQRGSWLWLCCYYP